MNSIFSDSTWFDEHCYVSACEDLEHHPFPCGQKALSSVCLITFSSGLYEQILKMAPYVDQDFHWPYQTTPLRLCATASGGKFFLHFPSFGGTRIANSLEQL